MHPGSRREGIGTQLISRFDEHFRSQGCEASVLEVFAPNAVARRFYEDLGYEERDLWLYRWL